MENLSLKPSTLYETGRTLRLRRLEALAGRITNPENEAAQLLEEVESRPMTGTQLMMRAQLISEASM